MGNSVIGRHGTTGRGARIPRRAGASLRALIALLLMLALPDAVLAQTEVRTRAWQHPDFGRIVFDWPERVDYSAERTGGDLIVRFDRPIASDLSDIAARLPAYVAGAAVEQGGRAVRFDLTGAANISSFRNENSIVVDLRPAGAVQAGDPPAPPAQEEPGPVAASEPQATGAPAAVALVPARVEDRGDATRIRFDWSSPVSYRVSRDGDQLSLRFDRPAAIDGRALAAALPDRLGRPVVRTADGATTVRLTLADGADYRDFTEGDAVVLEVLKPGTQAQASTAAPDAPDPPTPVLKPQAPQAPQTQMLQTQTSQTQTAGQSSERQADPPRTPEQPPAADPSSPPEIAPTPESDPETEVAAEPSQAEEAVSADAEEQQDMVDEEAARRAAEDAAAQQAIESGALTLRRDQADRQREERGPALVSFSFQWPESVGAAVFRRSDDIWIVFDRRAPIELAPLRALGEPMVERIEQLPVGGATVLRLHVPDTTLNPTARREGFDWVVDLRKSPLGPRRQVEIRAEANADTGPVLLFPTDEPSTIVDFPDPDVGDRFLIAPYTGSGHGMDGMRRYPEFDLLPTAQGVAMVTRAPYVRLDRYSEGYRIVAPEGLHISAVAPETPVSEGPSLSPNRLFDFERWKRGETDDYIAAREALYRTVSEVPESNRNDARLDIARFYLARGYGPEAKGVLQVVEGASPERGDTAEFRAMRGAAALLSRDHETAREAWSDPRLDGFAESAIWRGATQARIGDYKRAHESFRGGETLLRRYPYPLKGTLGLLRIEAALANRDLRTATSWINDLDGESDNLTRSQRGDLRYHQARVAAARTDFEEATDIWRGLADGPDRKNAVRSEQALINLGLQQGDVSRDEAIERLEDLRYKWRGDRFELMVLRRLGELYLEKDDYFNGLGALRTAVSYFPGDPVSEELAARMNDIFRRLYLEGEADKLPPLRALALYDEFRELTPSGPEGDRMIENLADRLVAVDLLDRAARVLERQVEFRLQGEEKARVGAKLALIRLIDGKPTQAIGALNDTNVLPLGEELQADRRRIRAKANFELGDTAEAVKLLAGDTSREADLLRRDVFWEAENWQEAAKVLQRLAGSPPENPAEGVPLDQARHVVNWAVAAYFDGDTRGLEDIKDIYGPAMANSELAGVFSFITTEPETAGTEDLSETVRRLSSGDDFNAFLEDYRAKLLGDGDDPAQDAAQGDAPADQPQG
ncbi:tetratricopeptide repeat protein [Marivibrio halodurans]|uniref:Tetratricopeptide repeat protein n=1 Tax=Marivibrio halodurans TaxID=2039722 RepID=A0A8J7RYI9_9PROT|nr:tetratricopeptide repeat protein [Marivibrio halodurans]MBP5856940.1 tetratricopeptide repeat protein [Marivibrio halodurans]